jgi:TolA-binding protein
MQSRVKLSRRQIKEDKFTAFMLSSRERLRDTWQYYVIGVVIVILAIVAVSYYLNSQEQRLLEAETRLSEAMSEYLSGQVQASILGFQSIISEYGSSGPARQATFLLGSANYDLKNYPEAIRAFQQYVDKYKDFPLRRAAAQAGIAACYENQGQYSVAAETFEKALELYPAGPQAGEFLLGALRCSLLAGNSEQAGGYYQRILNDFEGTDYTRRAEALLAELSTQG